MVFTGTAPFYLSDCAEVQLLRLSSPGRVRQCQLSDTFISSSPLHHLFSGDVGWLPVAAMTNPFLYLMQALLLVSANASSTGSTCSEHNMGDSVDGIDYQRCPLRPEETVLRRIISPRLLFPSSVTTRDLLIKEGLQRFFGSGHGEAVGAMLTKQNAMLTKPMLCFVQNFLKRESHQGSAWMHLDY